MKLAVEVEEESAGASGLAGVSGRTSGPAETTGLGGTSGGWFSYRTDVLEVPDELISSL
jgi:hypothetical protein